MVRGGEWQRKIKLIIKYKQNKSIILVVRCKSGERMATKIVELKKPKLHNPLFVEGLPGVGNVGRIASGYLIEELKAEKFAELYSSHFMPFVLLHQSSAVHVLKNEFYYWRAKKKRAEGPDNFNRGHTEHEPGWSLRSCRRDSEFCEKIRREGYDNTCWVGCW